MVMKFSALISLILLTSSQCLYYRTRQGNHSLTFLSLLSLHLSCFYYLSRSKVSL